MHMHLLDHPTVTQEKNGFTDLHLQHLPQPTITTISAKECTTLLPSHIMECIKLLKAGKVSVSANYNITSLFFDSAYSSRLTIFFFFPCRAWYNKPFSISPPFFTGLDFYRPSAFTCNSIQSFKWYIYEEICFYL